MTSLISFSQSSIPNGGFENWTTTSYQDLDHYVTEQGRAIYVLGIPTTFRDTNRFNGNYSVRMETHIVGQDTMFGFFTSGDFDTSNGFPYSQKPDSIVGYYKCGVQPGDSAILLHRFSALGTIFNLQVHNFTGAQNNWTRFAFPLNLPSTPDSMFIAAASSNALSYIGIQSGSWLMLDNLSFSGTGITQPILNGDFENWSTISFETPDNWTTTNDQTSSLGVYAATKTTDNHSGNHALKLETITVYDDTLGFVTNGSFGHSSITGGQPFSVVIDTLVGWYKYSPIGLDTAGFGMTFKKNGSQIGGAFGLFYPQSTYTQFELPFNLPQVPDTLRIDIVSSIHNVVGSSLLIDDLVLKSIITSLDKNTKYLVELKVYPNPTINSLTIDFEPIQEEMDVQIIDALGRLYRNATVTIGQSNAVFDVSDLAKGTYYVRMLIGEDLVYRAFVKN